MITTCLPTTSSLFQRSPEYGINASQKLLFEILFFQMYTFPLLSWSELKTEISLILLCRFSSSSLSLDNDIPPRVLSLFASLYFIYDNTSFNTNPESKSFCDHTSQVNPKTLLSYGMCVQQAAQEMNISCDMLRR